MYLKFLQRFISYGIEEEMEQALVNRIKRINLYYMILFVMLLISILWSAITMTTVVMAANSIMLAVAVPVYFLLPASRKPNLNSIIVLIFTAILLLSAYLFNLGISGMLVLAFYLLFPLGAVSVNGKRGIIVPIVLGILTLVCNYMPV